MNSLALLAAEGEVAAATGITAYAWLLVLLPAAGAAILLLGGKVTNAWGHLLATALRDPVARWNHPAWWIDALRRDHPDHWQAILEAGNAPPPMTLRVSRRLAPEEYLGRLASEGIEARPAGEQALVLGHAVPMPMLIRTRKYDPTFYAAIGTDDAPEVIVARSRRYEEIFGSDA